MRADGTKRQYCGSRLVKEADVILALGTRLGFNSTFLSYDNINQEAEIIHIEQEPTAIGRYFPIALGILADAPTAAVMLKEAVLAQANKDKADSWTRAFQQERMAYLAKRDETVLAWQQKNLSNLPRSITDCVMPCRKIAFSQWMLAPCACKHR